MEKIQHVLQKIHLGALPSKAAPLQVPNAEELQQLREKYTKANQEQVLAFYDSLNAQEKASLYHQLSNIDPNYINEITDRALNPPKAEEADIKSGLEPLPESASASILDSSPEDLQKWYDAGLDLIAEGKVAVLLLAGGQGTRLGSSAPKGCYDIGLPSHKSLFQIQAERILKIQKLARKKSGQQSDKIVLPWYVMTSGPTRCPTEKYFQEHNYFGLKEEQVVIFEQGVLPCISNDGKILLETKSKVCLGDSNSSNLSNFCRLLLPLMVMEAYIKLLSRLMS
jgi:UDP-N-acetylglucosamine/UDP-N-acetylgalactosamine diphosphorylase